MDTVEPITERQREVARLVAEGRSNPEIAEALGVSLAGAKYHVSELLGRLGVSSRDEIAEWYREHEGVASGGTWRSRLRMLVPLGAIAAAGAGALIVAVALEGGRDDSGAPHVSPTPTAFVEANVFAQASSVEGPNDRCFDLVPGGGSPWPTAAGLIQPSYVPAGWEIYSTDVVADDSCDLQQVRVLLAPLDAPPPGTGELDEWIAFVQLYYYNRWRVPVGDPIDLGGGRIAYQRETNGMFVLSWTQGDISTGLASNTAGFAPLIEIARSTSVTQGTPVVTWEVPRLPLSFGYEVEPGDTPATIAERFGVSEAALIWSNIDLDEMLAAGESNRFEQILVPGTEIRIPSVEGILHTVRVDETLTTISDRYGADWRDILEFEANGISDPNDLEPGSTILVPGGRPPLGSASSSAAVEWAWPVTGQVASAVGSEHPVGVDILAPLETEVRAAADGFIEYAGSQPCCDNRIHVIIAHEGGYETLYGHLADLRVMNGDRIKAGDVIGLVSETDEPHAIEPHLHFELRRNGVYQDPLAFLPSPSSSP